MPTRVDERRRRERPRHQLALGGDIDFAGFMDSYRQFFGGPAHPDLPARSTVEVAGLANPGWLIEIEVVAAVAP